MESCFAAFGNMSKIGRKTIQLPAGVTLEIKDGMVVIRGAKGELSEKMQPGISVAVVDNTISVTRSNHEKQTKAYHGLVRSLIEGMVIGVTQGFEKQLEMVGTGYRAALQGTNLSLSVGFSHPVVVAQPQGIVFKVEGNNKIAISGISKYLVGQTAANIRKIRPPEPYKGKGIKYSDEVVRRKAGKAVKAAGAAA